MEALIWIGIAVNVVGALYLMGFAVKYFFLYRSARNMPQKFAEYRARMAQKRMIGLGLMFGGAIIAIIGATLA